MVRWQGLVQDGPRRSGARLFPLPIQREMRHDVIPQEPRIHGEAVFQESICQPSILQGIFQALSDPCQPLDDVQVHRAKPSPHFQEHTPQGVLVDPQNLRVKWLQEPRGLRCDEEQMNTLVLRCLEDLLHQVALFLCPR